MSTPLRAGERPTVYLETLGCEKNLVDSEGALGILESHGLRFVEAPEDAELIVLNTCGFLASARDESIERLRELAARKRVPGARLVAMGCLVQGATHDLSSQIEGLDHSLGVGQYHLLPQLLEGRGEPALQSPDEAPYLGYDQRLRLTPPHVAYLKIAEGCSQSCTFCKIPALRGRQRSRGIPELLAEAYRLVESGARELVLIAQNSSSWGLDLPRQPRLGDLCAALADIRSLRWIRIMYAFPPMFDRRLAREIYAVDKVVSYLDIPIQHASPRILAKMKRGYDAPRLRQRIEELRRLRPALMLRSTALVGFPGETEDDLLRLLDFLDEIEFDHLGTFIYSHEERTAARGWEDDVHPAEKEDRRARVEQVQWYVGVRRRERLLGRPLEVVVDEIFEGADRELVEGIAIERGRDLRPEMGSRVGFARSEGFGFDIDGGIWLDGRGLHEGQFLDVVPVACGPHDLLAVRAEGVSTGIEALERSA
jgi:ribosomal protein S12 methylthiotransferase